MADAPTQETNKIDNYQLLNCLWTGKFSQVWEVVEEGTPMRFAMKLLLPEFTRERDEVQSLKWETKVGQQLEHPNLLTYYKLVANRNNVYLIMELFRSMNLKAFISNDLLGVHLRFRKLCESLLLVLGYIHDKGWIHKDIKPDNILLNKGSEVKLIDFSLSGKAAGGMAKLFRVKSKQIQGTRTYIAPETIKKQPPTPSIDIYSLGITLFEALTGVPPFTGASPNDLLRKHLAAKPPMPSELNSNVTPEMDRLIARMLAKKPKDRPSSLQEVYGEFRNLQPFKEEIEVLIARKKEEARERAELAEGLASKIDSRRDAGGAGGAGGAATKEPASAPAAASAAPVASSPPAAQPTAQPAAPVSAQPVPAPAPQSPVAQPQPAAARPPAPTPPPPAPPAQPTPPVAPTQPTTPEAPENDDDLPLMDELPPVL